MNECTIKQCNQGSKCDPSSPYVCLTNGGCSNDPNLWINSPACNEYCDATNCTRSYKCSSRSKLCEGTPYLPDPWQNRFLTEKQCYNTSKVCDPPAPGPRPGPKPGPAPDNGPRWCNRGNGTCEIPRAGMPANFETRTQCEEKCAANSDIKFSCTANGCVQDPNGMFRGTHAISDIGGNFIGYYSEECETNCKFGKNVKKLFFDSENSEINGNDCNNYPCSNEEIDNFKWIRGDYLLSFSDDSGAIVCTPVKDVPDGVTYYDNPLDCHNAFGNGGFYCEGSAGYCKLNENKNFGSTLENCHEKCANDSRTYTYNGKMCVEDPNSQDSLGTCLDNNATFDCSGPPYYTCNINKDGTGQYGVQQSYQCAKACRPDHGI